MSGQKGYWQQRIEAHWQQPKWAWSLLLWPLSRLFEAVATLREKAYHHHLLRPQKVAVPVVVVGNIHVGGVGKTPLVLALVESLLAKGVKVGVISRGYGRQSTDTRLVNEGSTAAEVGDEPMLIFHRTKIPVAVGSRRVAAAHLLLANHKVDVILTDDGLQHYALQRDLEIVAFPANDMHKKLDVMPNGPLRESLPRLNRIDALVVTGMQETLAKVVLAKQFGLNEHILIAQSQLAAGRFYALHDPTEQVDADYFAGKNVAALAGIGQPQKFFRTLHRLGVVINDKHGFADHHDYALQDVPQGMDALIVTEKDAVKLSKFPLENVWVLPVSATIEPDLAQFIMDKLSLD